MHLDDVRAQFPALERGAAFFDGPGGTQVPRSVAEAVTDYLFTHNANTHWAYPTSQETDALLLQAREEFAGFLKCRADEVFFGANMTSLTFHLSRALARGWQEGDEIVVTQLDHHANQDPWREIARDRGLTVRTAQMVPATGQLDYEDLARQITSRTRLVAVGAASNALGTINDLARVREIAGRALLFVDAVHYAPHAEVDVDCDFLACSAYKFYGPHVGVLYARRSVVDALDCPKLEPCEDPLETGTLNFEGIMGAAAAVRFLKSLGGSHHLRGEQLLEDLWRGLSAIPGVKLYGPKPGLPRTPTVAFTVSGHASAEVCQQAGAEGVFMSHGDFYATTVVRRLGLEEQGLVRAGCACYTSADDVLRLLQQVEQISR